MTDTERLILRALRAICERMNEPHLGYAPDERGHSVPILSPDGPTALVRDITAALSTE